MTLSVAVGETDTPLLESTIGDNLDDTAARFPDRDELVDVADGRRLTYAELVRDVDTLARGLLAVGIAKGDRVGIWAPNRWEWVLVQYATAKIGAVLVNVNPAYRTHELQYVLHQAGVRLLVSAPAFKTSDYAGMIEQVRPEVPALEQVVLLGEPSWDALVAAGASRCAQDLAARQQEL